MRSKGAAFRPLDGNLSNSECRLRGRPAISAADGFGLSVLLAQTANIAGGGSLRCMPLENYSHIGRAAD
jgi:hypothetical protein